MRVVFDTNLLVSYVCWPDATVRPLVKEIWRKNTVLRSVETLSELSLVLLRPKFDRYLPVAVREAFLEQFQKASEHISVHRHINICRDPKDNKFLELALAGRAKIIFTGDDDLLTLDGYKGLRIIPINGYD